MNESPDNYGLYEQGGWFFQNTRIDEGTNQVQRFVAAKQLRK